MTQLNSFSLPAPAKINHFLHIIGQRQDGYHNLETYFQFIDLIDTLDFQLNLTGDIQLTIDGADIEKENNLVYQIAQSFQRATNTELGVNIHLTKNIPIGAGLGGGSSNAATTLLGLNALWNINNTVSDLIKFGTSFGADIPIFIHGYAAFAQGIGEKLTLYSSAEKVIFLLKPECEILTAKLFCDQQLTRDSRSLRIDTLIDEGLTEFTDNRFKNETSHY